MNDVFHFGILDAAKVVVDSNGNPIQTLNFVGAKKRLKIDEARLAAASKYAAMIEEEKKLLKQ